jgi:hypothetical protein
MTEPVAARESQSGAALIVVMLLLLALTALGHGVFVLTLQEASASRASAALIQARVMAEGGVRRTLRAHAPDTLPDTGVGRILLARGNAADALYRVELARMSRELYWVEGVGAAALVARGPMRVRHRVGTIVWALSPVERLRAQSAAMEVGGSVEDPDGAIESWGARDFGAHDAPVGCRDRLAQIDSALAGRFFSPSRSVFLVSGRVPALGLLDEDSLLARAPSRVLGTVSPTPVAELGACVSGSLNWGSPSMPESPCGGRRVAIASEESLTLNGGEGQGLLVVRGDLHLTRGARFHGLALVSGDLRVDDGAVFVGMARVSGSLRVNHAARVSGRLCPALLALEAEPRLRRPLALPGSGWIRGF